MFRKIVFCLVFVALGAGCSMAQSGVDGWQDLVEQWAEQYDSETIPDDLVEYLQELRDNPVNLNDTSGLTLEGLPFLTDFQRRALRAYISQNGQMVSLNELFVINGVDTVTIRLLMDFAKVEPVEGSRAGIGELLRQGHSTMVAGTKTVFPRGRGYQEDIYAGSPFRTYFRYSFKSGNRISLQISGDNDAGERFGFVANDHYRQYGFDYYGYHLMLNDFGRMKRMIIGKYQLQFGQGATLWSGFAPWMSDVISLRRYGAGIRPASAFCEYGYLRGAATTIALLPDESRNALDLTVFYSNVDRDATMSAVSSEDGEPIFRSIYQSGYHRTDTEQSKKWQLGEQLYGGHLQFGNRNLAVGATAYATLFENAIAPASYAYNTFAFRGKENFNFGVDATYNYRNLTVFGEAAMSVNDVDFGSDAADWMPLAAVMGMQMHLGSDNVLSAAYRYGSPTYHNLYASVIGQGPSVANEGSAILSFKTTLPHYIHLSTMVDYSRFPTMRYNVYGPSSGVDYRMDIYKEIARNTVLDVKFRYKQSQRNYSEQMYVVETVHRRQVQASLNYTPSPSWRFVSRVTYCWSDSEAKGPGRGFLLFQEASWNGNFISRPLALGARLSLFDVSAYDARIYSYERDLQYEYGVPMLMGRGIRGFLVCRYSLAPHLVFALKYAVSFYPDVDTIGSGYDKTEGNKRQEIKAQFRLSF